jgi:hypothetical protein
MWKKNKKKKMKCLTGPRYSFLAHQEVPPAEPKPHVNGSRRRGPTCLPLFRAWRTALWPPRVGFFLNYLASTPAELTGTIATGRCGSDRVRGDIRPSAAVPCPFPYSFNSNQCLLLSAATREGIAEVRRRWFSSVPALGSARVVEGVRREPVKLQEPSIRTAEPRGDVNCSPEFSIRRGAATRRGLALCAAQSFGMMTLLNSLGP